ncbi:MAG TPA: protein phosphatase CheZ [Pseudolabrys sp.]|nr:protein phosphatase CheZ [Pseudolabrys sp.]
MQRKVFRVEQMLASRRAPVPRVSADPAKVPHALAPQHDRSSDTLKNEVAVLREIVAHNRRDIALLIGHDKDRHMPRSAGELGAAIAGMEKATQKILEEAEAIDERARTLSSTLKTDYERGLAQDIQDHTVRVYEACNFQDLSGQRIAQVIEMLNLLDEQLSAMLARCNGQPIDLPSPKPCADDGLLNGPRLDGASGHASQRDIDMMFD